MVVDGEEFTKNTTVQAVSPLGYAVLSGLAFCPADAHGDPGDPHSVTGPIISGSSTVAINGMPAARSGDVGVHSACSGPNTFEIIGGVAVQAVDTETNLGGVAITDDNGMYTITGLPELPPSRGLYQTPSKGRGW